MNVLIIGFGSIGKRHYKILNNLSYVKKIDIVTTQKVNNKNSTIFINLKDVPNLGIYDYFVIASKTSTHFNNLAFINGKVIRKKILVEKPLFEKYRSFKNLNNKIYVGYNLRFHPLLAYLKEFLKNKKVLYVNCYCGQYLPSWRKTDYRKSYSSSAKDGGGVLRDLSHEIDYLSWIFGDFKKLKYINTKVSNLDISSDDLFLMLSETTKKTVINLSLDYFSKAVIRKIIIHTENVSLIADIVNYKISVFNKKMIEKTITIKKENRDFTYIQMHNEILQNKNKSGKVSTFDDSIKILNIFKKVKCKVSDE